MRRCLELAGRALATGDAPVGALVVRHEEIVAEGVEGVQATGDVTAHAEIVAVRAACDRLGSRDLSACSLYTTVAPCPMCAYAIRLARLGLVVSGAPAGNPDGPLNGWRLLATAEFLPERPVPQLVGGVLLEECRAMLRRRQP